MHSKEISSPTTGGCMNSPTVGLGRAPPNVLMRGRERRTHSDKEFTNQKQTTSCHSQTLSSPLHFLHSLLSLRVFTSFQENTAKQINTYLGNVPRRPDSLDPFPSARSPEPTTAASRPLQCWMKASDPLSRKLGEPWPFQPLTYFTAYFSSLVLGFLQRNEYGRLIKRYT